MSTLAYPYCYVSAVIFIFINHLLLHSADMHLVDQPQWIPLLTSGVVSGGRTASRDSEQD